MTTEFSNKLFHAVGEWSDRIYSDIVFTKCTFHSCYLGIRDRDIVHRPIARDIEMRRCELLGQGGCTLVGTISEDILISNLKTDGLVQTWAAVFKHVTLKGTIDRLMLSPFFHPGYPTSRFQQVIAKANAEYYASIDWALDIREAEFKEFDCRGVPSRLVRRDPETQIMVTRERVLSSGDAIRAGGEFWQSWLELFLQDNWYADGVLVAPKRDKRFKELVAGLKKLRHAGVAEPD